MLCTTLARSLQGALSGSDRTSASNVSSQYKRNSVRQHVVLRDAGEDCAQQMATIFELFVCSAHVVYALSVPRTHLTALHSADIEYPVYDVLTCCIVLDRCNRAENLQQQCQKPLEPL